MPDFARVRCWESFEANGFIFVWHHAEGDAPTWWPRPVAAIEDGSWAFVGRNEFLVSCHIQEIPENGADVAHLNAVHGPGMVGRGLSRHLWDAQWSPGADDMQHTATLRLNHQLDLFGKFRMLKMDVCANQVRLRTNAVRRGPGRGTFAAVPRERLALPLSPLGRRPVPPRKRR